MCRGRALEFCSATKLVCSSLVSKTRPATDDPPYSFWPVALPPSPWSIHYCPLAPPAHPVLDASPTHAAWLLPILSVLSVLPHSAAHILATDRDSTPPSRSLLCYHALKYDSYTRPTRTTTTTSLETFTHLPTPCLTLPVPCRTVARSVYTTELALLSRHSFHRTHSPAHHAHPHEVTGLLEHKQKDAMAV